MALRGLDYLPANVIRPTIPLRASVRRQKRRMIPSALQIEPVEI